MTNSSRRYWENCIKIDSISSSWQQTNFWLRANTFQVGIWFWPVIFRWSLLIISKVLFSYSILILGESISEIINNGIRYLDNRTEFWRQQKPMYTRYVKKYKTDFFKTFCSENEKRACSSHLRLKLFQSILMVVWKVKMFTKNLNKYHFSLINMV